MAAFRVGLSISFFFVVHAASGTLTEVSSDAPLAEVLQQEGQCDHVSLLQKAAVKHVTKAKGSKTKDPNPAGWFGSFSEGESTFTEDGTLANRDQNPEVNVLDGWDPSPSWSTPTNIYRNGVESADWFQNSESGGYKQAWQTFYPAMSASVPGNGVQTGKWFTGTGSQLQENYRSENQMGTNSVPASWFDDSVNQLDGFGRDKYPGINSDRRYLYWEEKTVSTPISCKDPGCTAHASLLAPFDSKTEYFKECKLNVQFHPTDFDDQYAGEMIEWVNLGDKLLQERCWPMSHGCNKTMERPLLSCVDDVPVDMLIPQDGKLKISAKIPLVVDECPYKGNLLSGVAAVTCMVSPKKPPPPIPPIPPIPPTVKYPSLYGYPCVTKMPLQCPTRGCAADIAMPVDCGPRSNAKRSCKLSLTVNQTDYDGVEGMEEVIEYIKVEGKQVATNLKPGMNPCYLTWIGKTYPASDLTYSVLKDYDVTEAVSKKGEVQIGGKISEYVDECASNGYLFDAMVEVVCTDAFFTEDVDKAKQTVDATPDLPLNPLKPKWSWPNPLKPKWSWPRSRKKAAPTGK